MWSFNGHELNSMDINLSKLGDSGGQPGMLQSMRPQRIQLSDWMMAARSEGLQVGEPGCFSLCHGWCWGFPGGSDGKASARSVEGPGLIPGSGRSPGEGNGNPLQYSCLENSMDGGAWWGTVHGVTSQRVGHDWATSLLISQALMKVFDSHFILPKSCDLGIL